MRKYLEEIGITDTPETWLPDDERQQDWANERKTYGFDMREIFNLDHTFYLWLYERVKMYLETAPNDLDFHKFDYDGREYTQGQMIKLLLKYLEEYFNNNCEYTDTTCKIGEIWGKILPTMWQ